MALEGKVETLLDPRLDIDCEPVIEKYSDDAAFQIAAVYGAMGSVDTPRRYRPLRGGS
jgi:hypothetical protein